MGRKEIIINPLDQPIFLIFPSCIPIPYTKAASCLYLNAYPPLLA